MEVYRSQKALTAERIVQEKLDEANRIQAEKDAAELAVKAGRFKNRSNPSNIALSQASGRITEAQNISEATLALANVRMGSALHVASATGSGEGC